MDLYLVVSIVVATSQYYHYLDVLNSVTLVLREVDDATLLLRNLLTGYNTRLAAVLMSIVCPLARRMPASSPSRPRRILYPPETRHKLDPLIPFHLFALFCLHPHRPHTLIHALAAFPLPLLKYSFHSRKARMLFEMAFDPLVQILHIGDGVYDPPGAQNIGILRVERVGYDAGLVLALFEMRVGETEEDFGELVFGEEVGEEFHGVGT